MSEVSQEIGAAVQPARKIILWSTKSNTKNVLNSSATTWGELKKEISRETTINIDGLLATENVRRTDLASDLASLPEQPFVVYLRAKETKSGGLSHKELRANISEALKNDASAKDHFNEGKNYTTKTTVLLQELWDSYGNKGVKSEKKVAAPKEAIGKVIEKVKETVVAKEVTTNKVTEVPKEEDLSTKNNVGEKQTFTRPSIALGLTSIRTTLYQIRDFCENEEVSDAIAAVLKKVKKLDLTLLEENLMSEPFGKDIQEVVEAEVESPQDILEREAKEKAVADKIAKDKEEAEENRLLREESLQLNDSFKR